MKKYFKFLIILAIILIISYISRTFFNTWVSGYYTGGINLLLIILFFYSKND